MAELKCPVCGERKRREVFDEFGVHFFRCAGCTHVYSDYSQDQDYGGYFGENVQPLMEGDQRWWDEAHEAIYTDFASHFLEGQRGRLLDVGCGLGYFVKYLRGRDGWQVFGSEMSEEAVLFGRQKLGLDNLVVGPVQQAGFESASFDVVTLWDVIEHIPDPYPVMDHIRTLLKPDGTVFFHTPNINVQLPKVKIKKALKGMQRGAHYLEAGDHVNLYTPRSIEKMLREAGFDQIAFHHFRPIQGVAGTYHPLGIATKNAYVHLARIVATVTGGRCNWNNLFVTAKPKA